MELIGKFRLFTSRALVPFSHTKLKKKGGSVVTRD